MDCPDAEAVGGAIGDSIVLSHQPAGERPELCKTKSGITGGIHEGKLSLAHDETQASDFRNSTCSSLDDTISTREIVHVFQS